MRGGGGGWGAAGIFRSFPYNKQINLRDFFSKKEKDTNGNKNLIKDI